MNTAVIVQARYGSSRLPGKVLTDLGGRTALWHVLTRCSRIVDADVICCAVPKSSENDPVAREAEALGVQVFRGSQDDVLDRYFQAADFLSADIILRVTGDCPLINPEICARVIERLKEGDVTFACNNRPRSFPHGLDCEAFSFEWLKRAADEENRAAGREHVSDYFLDHSEARIGNVVGEAGALIRHRWTLDYPEDLNFFRALFDALPEPVETASLKTLVAFLNQHPEISALNHCRLDIQQP